MEFVDRLKTLHCIFYTGTHWLSSLCACEIFPIFSCYYSLEFQNLQLFIKIHKKQVVSMGGRLFYHDVNIFVLLFTKTNS